MTGEIRGKIDGFKLTSILLRRSRKVKEHL